MRCFYSRLFILQKAEEDRRKAELELLSQKRLEYKEKKKNAMMFNEIPPEKRPPKGKGKKQIGDLIDDSSDSDRPRDGSPAPR